MSDQPIHNAGAEVTNRPTFIRTKETEAAIKLLKKAEIGRTVTWLELAEAMECEPTDHRESVASALRSLERDGIIYASVRGIGYMRLDNSGIVDKEVEAGGRIRRAAKRSLKRLAVVEPDKLEPQERIRYAVAFGVAGAVALCASREKRNLLEQTITTEGGKRLEIGDTMRLFGKK